MRSILIGAVEGTDVAIEEMRNAGLAPALLATLAPALGAQRHADYIDLAALCGPETEIVFVDQINDDRFVDRVRAIAPDVIFVIGWSQLIGHELRALATRYVVGFHPTPLPILRGRAAIAWTLLSGATRSGTSLFVIDDGVDTGPILDQHMFDLDPRETVASLIARNKESLRLMLRRTLPRIADGSIRPVPQQESGASYGARRTAEDALIDWTQTAAEIDRLIRAQGPPYGGAFTFTRRSRVTIWEATPFQTRVKYFAANGQICFYDADMPVILCGKDSFLRIERYDVVGREPGFRFSGQVRLGMDQGGGLS